ncbi:MULTISPECIES: hypothetical protein [Desulfosporosinus]|uniref:Lipoprotein n=1 Tax=Desulfosporosinus acididurans TaxID=476652 RepID=A0A0J1IHU7_9FIRM|nr:MULTISPECIES: hypothetical protein [Desulfosporosinus]KLU64256.1 hypothetical protein DEAC_c38890 [Desulfosporosinus acididurans]
MKRFRRKAISVSLAILSTLLVLTGCGTQSSSSAAGTPNATSTANKQEAAAPNLMTSQQQVKSIDIKAAKGKQEVNAQINENLKNLDKSLNALNRSLGNL